MNYATMTGVGAYQLVFQLLFKVEGQSVTNQRTEPHKSLISKDVSLNSNSVEKFPSFFVLLRTMNVHHQTLKTKQKMLKEDWEFFKQRRFIEEQLKVRMGHCGSK